MKSISAITHFALPLLLAMASTLPADETIQPNSPQPKHGLDFAKPTKHWDESIPMGNGLLGAMLWGDGHPVKISIDRADLWDCRPVPEFHKDNYTFQQMKKWHDAGNAKALSDMFRAPYLKRPGPTKIPAGRIELSMPKGTDYARSTLDLAKAKGTMTFTDGTRLDMFVHATEPVGMIHIEGGKNTDIKKIGIKLIVPPFGGKKGQNAKNLFKIDLSDLGYPEPIILLEDEFQAYVQKDSDGFMFAVFVKWKKTEQGMTLAWSVATNREVNAENPKANVMVIAMVRVINALKNGYDKELASHVKWWDQYWTKSSIRIPNPVIERQWYLEQYKFGSASRRGAPPISLQAIWTADNGKIPPWKGDYHHDLNTELSYWPYLSSNHLECGRSYVDWLWETRDAARDWTKRFFRLPGMNVPMTATIEGKQMGGAPQYTHSATTSAWLANAFYQYWLYSADRDFLRDRAYPYLRDASVFLEAFTAHKDKNGKRTFPLSASPEYNECKLEAWFKGVTNFDLALSRWLFAATAELADELGKKEDAARWRKVLAELPEFTLDADGGLALATNAPLGRSHRHQSHLLAIHPLGLIDVADGPKSKKIIDASLARLDRIGTKQWVGYSFAWLVNLAARAGDGEKAERAAEIFSTAFCLRNSFHCNGDQSGKNYSRFKYRPFTLEGNFALAAGVQEMLLQSHRGEIRLFPAVPKSWRDASFTTLRAAGGFLVSAERKNGKTTRVEITSEKGGTCRICPPGSDIPKNFTLKPREALVLE